MSSRQNTPVGSSSSLMVLYQPITNTMEGLMRNATVQAAAKLELAGAHTVIDIGGGRGGLIRAILESHPNINGTVFDLEDALSRADPALHQRPLAARSRLVAGDARHQVPVAGDVYLLKHVLHIFDDDTCVAILRNIRDQAPPAARIIIIEQLLADHPDAAFVTLMDLQMLITTGGRERTEAEFTALGGAPLISDTGATKVLRSEKER